MNHKKNRTGNRRIISFVMALLMMFGAVNADMLLTVNAATTWYENENLQKEHRGSAVLISYNSSGSSLFRPTEVYWENPRTGAEQHAYCVNPIWAGIEDVANEYAFDIMSFDDTTTVNVGDKNASSTSTAGNNMANALAGVIVHGYPSRSAEEVLGLPYSAVSGLGVSQADYNWAAYVATKYAGWAMVRDEYADFTRWSAYGGSSLPQQLCDATMSAMKEIYNFASTYIPPTGTNLTVTKSPSVENGTYVEVTCTLNGGSVPSGSKYYIRGVGASTLPAGAIITNSSSVEYPKETIGGLEQYAIPSSDTAFIIKYPTPANKPYDIKLNFELYAERGNPPVLTYAKSKLDNRQSYIMAGTGFDNVPFDVEFKDGDKEPQDPAEKETGGNDGSITVYKYKTNTDGSGSRIPLEGVVIELIDFDGHHLGTKTTNASGTVSWTNLPLGAYFVREIYNNGYDYILTPPTSHSVVLTTDNPSAEVSFYNDSPQDVTPHKVDADTGEPIPGVEFEISQIDGNGNWKAVGETKADGTCTWSNVPDGVYSIREVSTVSGYILDQTPQTVVVSGGRATSVKFTNSKYPGLTITKVDSQTGESITANETEFHVEQIDGSYTHQGMTSNGILSLKELPVGTYKITEITAPKGYVKNECPTSVYLEAGKNIQVVIQNTKKPQLTIEKIDGQSGSAVPGTKFEVKKSDGTVMGTVTTGSDGTVTIGLGIGEIPYLDSDVYTVTEVFVPEPYVLSGEHQDIRLEAGDKKNLLFANLEMPIITVEKYDEKTGEKLPGAQIAIYEQDDRSRPVAEGMTDSKGQFTTGYIKPGTYVVKELLPPPGYMVSSVTETTRTIVAKAGDGEIIVKIDNIKLPELTIKKVDAVTGDAIEGVTYRIEKTDGVSTQPSTATTDANGLIVIPGLESGTYTITEISTPSIYILNPKPQYVTLAGGDTKTVLFENTLYPTLVIYKYDYTTNKPIANTTFKVEYEDSNGGIKTIGTYRTNAEGYIILPYVNVGWYILTETIAAQGYQLPSNPVQRLYLKAGDNSYTAYDNQGGQGGTGSNGNIEIGSGLDYPNVGGVVNYPLNALVIKKSDANTGEMLAGATFEVLRVSGETSGQNGTLICTVTSDTSGTIVITGLEAGAYTVKEISAPPNYTISETNLQSVNLKADATSCVEIIFQNHPYGAISINKKDGATGLPLPGATFKITDASGAVVGDNTYVTDANGNILVPNVPSGSYVITELKAPDNYAISTEPQTVLVGTDGKTYTTTFINYPYGSLIIRKFDENSKEPLAGAVFKVTDSSGAAVGLTNGQFTTDATGVIAIPNIGKGTYVITEIKPPEGYSLSNNPTQTIYVDYTNVYTADFYNIANSGVQLTKIDGHSKLPLSGAEFTLYKQNGEVYGHYTTDSDGLITIPQLADGWYSFVEKKAPQGYAINSTPIEFQMIGNQFLQLTMPNSKLQGLIIQKIDATDKQALEGAVFEVWQSSDSSNTSVSNGTPAGNLIGTYTTDHRGLIELHDLADGVYTVSEIKAPDGYMLTKANQVVSIKASNNTPTTVTFTNSKIYGVQIIKKDSQTGLPLQGATFEIWNIGASSSTSVSGGSPAGQLIGSYTTDINGIITVALEDGVYEVIETIAPKGYRLDNAKQDITVKAGQQATVTFTNTQIKGVQIIKKDSLTGLPLQGAQFEIWDIGVSTNTSVSSGTPAGQLIGTYTTDLNGLITVDLKDGTYTIIESKAPDGYQIDTSSQNITVAAGQQTTVTFTNTPIIGLQILKLDNSSRDPLQGATFEVRTPDNTLIGTYTTDYTGSIMIPGLASGTYVVTETKAPNGYRLNSIPQTVTVSAGKASTLTFTNEKLATVILKKLDSATEQPIEGAVFQITTATGDIILDELVTDATGLIHITNLSPGTYFAKEIKAPTGYNIAEAKMFTVRDNSTYAYNDVTATGVSKEAQIVTIYNDPLGMSQIIKTDAVTGRPVAGAEYVISNLSSSGESNGQTFLVAGQNANNVQTNGLSSIIGYFTTSEAGIINISNLPKGWYTLQERSAPEGYELDATVYNFQITGNGVPTILKITNTPIMGKIALTKLSEDYNNNTGWDTNTPLSGAVYDILDKNGFVVDTITTGADGTAISNPLILGSYTLKEVKPPAWYGISTQNIQVSVKKQGQVVAVVAKDPSINLNLGIKKTSDTKSCTWGDTINYYITGVGNESNVALDKFTVHDKLPDPSVAQIKYFDTGMWNKKYQFKFSYATNLDTSYRELPGTYSSDQHHMIDLYAPNMGLLKGEYVTQVKMEFQGQVVPGFKLIEAISAQMIVNSNINNGFQFTNYADVSGRWQDQIITANSHWTITVYHTNKKLPKTS